MYRVPGIYQADVLEGLDRIPSSTVHCVVTSPPYWSQRTYATTGQIGLEATPAAHLEVLVRVFTEVARVLRPDGTLWLNYGDCFRNGNLQGLPWRLALALQEHGWWLRSDVIWAKPNPVPESVKSRPTKSHEHLFLLARSANYYYDVDGYREPTAASTVQRARWGRRVPHDARGYPGAPQHLDPRTSAPPQGRQVRDVWSFSTDTTRGGGHKATFPREMVRRCLLLSTSDHGVCSRCRAPWTRQVEIVDQASALGSDWRKRRGPINYAEDLSVGIRGVPSAATAPTRTTVGWQPSCSCHSTEVVPALVLDPFMGSGTVAVVAKELGRNWLGFDLNADYVQQAQVRVEGAPGRV